MADQYQPIINEFLNDLKKAEEEVLQVKGTINALCLKAGKPKMFSDSELSIISKPQSLRSDQFHGRPLATVVREYLEMRRQLEQGPATTAEIFDALVEGGYEFHTKSDQISKISLGNSLGKNPVFYKLPNKKWGLAEWYPSAKKKRTESTNGEDGDDGETLSEAKPVKSVLQLTNRKEDNQ